jgi:hypothetical protein
MHQAFHGATELIRVQCGDGLILTVRTESRIRDSETADLEFAPADAIPVRESPERN